MSLSQNQEPSPGAVELGRQAPLRFLLVGNESEVAALAHSLQKLDSSLEIDTCRTAKEALTMLEEKRVTSRYHAVLSDLELPGEKDGFYISTRLQGTSPNTQFFMLTKKHQELVSKYTGVGLRNFGINELIDTGNLERQLPHTLSQIKLHWQQKAVALQK